jgi:hypothetical protein
MGSMNEYDLFLACLGGAVMVYVTLKSIGQGAMAVASVEIRERRAAEARRRDEDAAAEAAGLAAAIEPLAMNPDGSIEEAIIAAVETR